MNSFFKQKITPTINTPGKMIKLTCIGVDSKDRNTIQFPDCNKFAVNFNSNRSDTSNASISMNMKDIISIRLIECILPDTAQSDRYLILVIPELNVSMDGTSDILSKAFCLIYPDKTYGTYLHCRFSENNNSFKKYYPPLGKINRLTFELYKQNGELFTVNSSDQIFYHLEFETIVGNTTSLHDTLVT